MLEDLIFPESISMKSTYTIEYKTTVCTAKNGYELRIANIDYPLLSYNIINDLKSKTEIENLVNFFKLTKGKAIGFKFKDWLDYKVNSQVIATADGENKDFQLIKTYLLGNHVQIRKITKPIEGTVKIYVNDIEDKTNISIDYEKGLVSFSSAPANNSIIKADFEFYVPVRFDTDKLDITMKNSKYGEIKELKIIEIIS